MIDDLLVVNAFKFRFSADLLFNCGSLLHKYCVYNVHLLKILT